MPITKESQATPSILFKLMLGETPLPPPSLFPVVAPLHRLPPILRPNVLPFGCSRVLVPARPAPVTAPCSAKRGRRCAGKPRTCCGVSRGRVPPSTRMYGRLRDFLSVASCAQEARARRCCWDTRQTLPSRRTGSMARKCCACCIRTRRRCCGDS